MKSNFLVIIFSGISISLLGTLILVLPVSVKQLVERNMEFFLTIPPLAVARYILVFKCHEKLQNEIPSFGALLRKPLQGAAAAFVFFSITAIITGLLFRAYMLVVR